MRKCCWAVVDIIKCRNCAETGASKTCHIKQFSQLDHNTSKRIWMRLTWQDKWALEREPWGNVVKGSGTPLNFKHYNESTRYSIVWKVHSAKLCLKSPASQTEPGNYCCCKKLWCLLKVLNRFLKRVLRWGSTVNLFLFFQPLSAGSSCLWAKMVNVSNWFCIAGSIYRYVLLSLFPYQTLLDILLFGSSTNKFFFFFAK